MLKETTTKVMINNKEELKAFLNEDLKRFRLKPVGLRDFVLGNEKWYTYHYIKQLRYVEYCMNSKSGGGN